MPNIGTVIFVQVKAKQLAFSSISAVRCGAFAEFERGMIQERIRAGLARAKKAGKQLGRQEGSRGKSVLPKLAEAKAMLTNGTGIMKTAKLVGLGPGRCIGLSWKWTLAAKAR